MHLGKFAKAAKCYDSVLELDYENAVPCNNKGNALRNLLKYGEASKHLIYR